MIALLGPIGKILLTKRQYSKLRKKWYKYIGNDFYKNTVVETNNDLLEDNRLPKTLKTMLIAYENCPKEFGPSNYWKVLNRRNIAQLLDDGFGNFKQTVALNYFTTLLKEGNPQLSFVIENSTQEGISWARGKAKKCKRHDFFNKKRSFLFNFYTFLLWKYVQQQVGYDHLQNLHEPEFGNPPSVFLEGRRISQDIAYSALEYHSIMEGVKNFENVHTVCEMGAGYGRSAYVILFLNPGIKYIVVDIPPALYISQRYLSAVFPDRKKFLFREFNDFSDIMPEFNEAEIVFLMPHQFKNIPNKFVDLFLAIDCLHEMLPSQIDGYFDIIDKLAKQFYFCCWKETKIPIDDFLLTEKDYPIKSHWEEVFWRERKVYTTYFEAFFNL